MLLSEGQKVCSASSKPAHNERRTATTSRYAPVPLLAERARMSYEHQDQEPPECHYRAKIIAGNVCSMVEGARAVGEVASLYEHTSWLPPVLRVEAGSSHRLHICVSSTEHRACAQRARGLFAQLQGKGGTPICENSECTQCSHKTSERGSVSFQRRCQILSFSAHPGGCLHPRFGPI